MEWPQLRRLYGEEVVTGELLSPGAAGLGAEAEGAARLATQLAKTLLVVDEHPTLTRFGTFGGAIGLMLCMSEAILAKVFLLPPAQEEVAVVVRRIICAVHEDTGLDVAAAVTAVLAQVRAARGLPERPWEADPKV